MKIWQIRVIFFLIWQIYKNGVEYGYKAKYGKLEKIVAKILNKSHLKLK